MCTGGSGGGVCVCVGRGGGNALRIPHWALKLVSYHRNHLQTRLRTYIIINRQFIEKGFTKESNVLYNVD